jgi:hypothetical protein
MLHKLKSSLAQFAESDEVAMILKQMLSVRAPPAYVYSYGIRRLKCIESHPIKGHDPQADALSAHPSSRNLWQD